MGTTTPDSTKVERHIPAFVALRRKPQGGQRPCYTETEVTALALSLVQTCQHCHETFVTKTLTLKADFCSRLCKNKGRRPNLVFSGTSGSDRSRGHQQATALISECQICHDPFLQTNYPRTTRCCSVECGNLAQRSSERRRIRCRSCKQIFDTKRDHGKWPSYCSRKCLKKTQHHALKRPCANCGEVFLAKPTKEARDGDHNHKFCSAKCKGEQARKGAVENCLNCGSSFYSTAALITKGKHDGRCCSSKCQGEYYRRDRSWAWKGGVVQQNQRVFRRIDRSGYAAKYEGEHRLVAERTIGRTLRRGEVVICLDRNNDNWAESNLFICPSQKEFGFIRQGAVPWPEMSNLEVYRASGYQRPEIIVVVYEWENGKRLGAGGRRTISRHPQADEIIKRRRAGASIRDLAKAFGSSSSAMRETLVFRL